MSNAALTDSTAHAASSALRTFPSLGRSTNTTSVISCWAWSEIPTVPSAAIHSWVLVKRRSFGFIVGSSVFLQDMGLDVERRGRRLGGDDAVVDPDGQGALGSLRED